MRFTKWSSLGIMLGVVICFAFLVAFEKQPPREILIKFKPEAHSTQVDSLISALSLTKVKSIKEIDVNVFRVPSELSVAEVVKLCSTLPFVVYAEPTMAVRTQSARASASPAEPTAAFQPQAQTAEYRPGEVIIKFKSSVNQQQADSFLADVGIQVEERYNELGILKCMITGSKDVLTAVAECNANQNIEYAEPNYIYRRTIVPNDPSFSSLYGMRIIDAPEAWDVQTGSKSIIVGVIDTGVAQDHEDLQANTWTNPGESGGGKETNNIDDDGNGLVDDFRGWDFINNDNNPFDDNDHGTHVSGTIGAVGNNSVGVTGVNWNVSIMALKFLGGDGSGDTGDAVEAIIYGTNQGAKVLSNSWGGGGRSQALEDAIRFANDRGVLFVAAAGNASSNNDTFPSFPANYQVDNVVSVASSTSSDDISSFSNTGRRSVHLAAPGSAILSTKPRNQYQNLSGTSMATPHVSGAAALVWAQFPSLTMAEVKIRILGSVDRKNSFAGKVITGGRLNVNKALSTNPIIANTTQLENSLNEAGPYVVEADILDDGSIQSASLTYQVVGQSAVPLPMNLVSGHHYRGEIPGQALGTNITYFVKASDADGNETQDANFSFSIAEPADPGCGCGKPAIDLAVKNAGLRTAVNAVVNLSFFVLPVVLIRNRTKRRK